MLPDTSNVSRETEHRLRTYVDLLLKWNERINLIGSSTEKDIYRRHIQDSIQIGKFCTPGGSVTDMGTGGGLPGIVLAITGNHTVALLESDKRKCAFLNEAVRILGLDNRVTVYSDRIESVSPLYTDYIVSRACAPLPLLLSYAGRHAAPHTRCVFLKGKRVHEEISVASKWRFEYTLHPSGTNPEAAILELWNLEKVPCAL